MARAELSYCGDLVRRHDPDRFLLSLMMPPEQREALWALFAFNYEIARTREIVTETTLGLIRLQWWRDAVTAVYDCGTVPQNEILPSLAQAIKTYDLPRDAFETLIYAREFDLETMAPASLEGLTRYAGFTNAPLMRLSLKITGQDEADAAIEKTGSAFGLTGILRAVPFHARQGRCLMPTDIMATHGVAEKDIYGFSPGEAFQAVVGVVAERAGSLLAEARPCSKFLKLSNMQSRLYLNRIRGLKHDVFDPQLALGPPFFHLQFLAGAMVC